MAIKSYRDLVAWQKAMDLAEAVYKATMGFPGDERFGLTQQLRRAGVSVASNIAEGQGRTTTRAFLNFLSMAYGSLCEVETQVLLAQRLHYLPEEEKNMLLLSAAELGRLLNGLMNALREKGSR